MQPSDEEWIDGSLSTSLSTEIKGLITSSKGFVSNDGQDLRLEGGIGDETMGAQDLRVDGGESYETMGALVIPRHNSEKNSSNE